MPIPCLAVAEAMELPEPSILRIKAVDWRETNPYAGRSFSEFKGNNPLSDLDGHSVA